MCCELSLTEASTIQCTSWCAVNSAWLKLQPPSVHHDVLWTQLDWSFSQPVYIMMCCELSLTEASTSQCTLWCAVNSAWLKLQPASVHYNVQWTRWLKLQPASVHYNVQWTRWLKLQPASVHYNVQWTRWLKLQPASVHYNVQWTRWLKLQPASVHADWSFNQPVYLIMCNELADWSFNQPVVTSCNSVNHQSM